MLNKDKRSMFLALALGDGCLHYIKNGGKLYGALTITHCAEQGDYLAWKAKLLSELTARTVKVRPAQMGLQLSVSMKRIRAWRRYCYPGGQKDRTRLLRYLRHPELAFAIWLMDDGYVEPSIQNGKLYSCSLRIFSCSSSEETHAVMVDWFDQNFGVRPLVKQQRTRGKAYPFMKFRTADSLKLWGIVRPHVLQFKSMQHKFRHMEHLFQSRCLQRPPEQPAALMI